MRDDHAPRQARDAVTPGCHMDKKHWSTIHGGAGVTKEYQFDQD